MNLLKRTVLCLKIYILNSHARKCKINQCPIKTELSLRSPRNDYHCGEIAPYEVN